MQIKLFTRQDIAPLVAVFRAIEWNDKSTALFEQYLAEQDAGQRLVWVAHKDSEIAGYVTLVWQSEYKPFSQQSIPEIKDLNVLPAFRNQGIGSLLMTVAEEAAKTRSGVVGIGVGLYDGYGAAQRLYVRRGYLPDEKGITHNYQPVTYGTNYPVDDDLVLWFTKVL